MTITNRMGLPESLVNACQTEPHNKPGEVSATTLLKGTKQIMLEKRHWGELEDDVSDRVWAVFGTAVHKLLEEKNPEAFTEERFSTVIGRTTVTGQVDLYDMATSTITDYKTASVWKVIMGDFEDWRRQGLVYAYLMLKNGIVVERCRFVAMLRDWSKAQVARDPAYPKSQCVVYEFEVTARDLDEIRAFIESKVDEIERMELRVDDDIPPCTEKERWAKGDTYAVMKAGRKTALKVFDDFEKAKEFASAESGRSVEKRPGKSARCENYCLCAKFCSFYKSMKEGEDEKKGQ